MSSAPGRFEDWTYESIADLVKAGQGESDTFDFKAALAGDGLSKAVCSFANSRGGFLIFGVAGRGGQWTIEGLPANREFAAEFTRQLKAEPEVPWRGPRAIAIPGNERVLYVLEVPASARRPHVPRATGASTLQAFWRRGNGTAVAMTLEEIRDQMLGTDARRVSLHLLAVELHDAWRMQKAASGQPNPCEVLAEFDHELVARLMAEAYPTIGSDQRLMDALLGLRRTMRSFNIVRDHFHRVIFTPLKLGKDSEPVMASLAQKAHGNLNSMNQHFAVALTQLRDQYGVTDAPPGD